MIRRNGSEMQPPQAAITAGLWTGCIAPQLKKQIPFFNEAMLLFPKTTWFSVWREPPLIRLAFYHLNLEVTPLQLKRLVDVKNCFASENWDLLHYYLLFQDPFLLFWPESTIQVWLNQDHWMCHPAHHKKAMSDFHFEEIHKSVQLLQGAGCQKFRTKRQISKSENTQEQDLQSDDKSAVKVCCPSNVSLMLQFFAHSYPPSVHLYSSSYWVPCLQGIFFWLKILSNVISPSENPREVLAKPVPVVPQSWKF